MRHVSEYQSNPIWNMPPGCTNIPPEYSLSSQGKEGRIRRVHGAVNGSPTARRDFTLPFSK